MASNVPTAFVGVVSLETFLGLYALHGHWVLVLDVKEDPIYILHVDLPSLEPFEANNVADVLALLLVVDFIPLMEVLHQLLLHLLLFENVEEPPELTEVKVLCRPFEPLLQTKRVIAPQQFVDHVLRLDVELGPVEATLVQIDGVEVHKQSELMAV